MPVCRELFASSESEDDIILTDVESDSSVDVHSALLDEKESTRPQLTTDAVQFCRISWLYPCIKKKIINLSVQYNTYLCLSYHNAVLPS